MSRLDDLSKRGENRKAPEVGGVRVRKKDPLRGVRKFKNVEEDDKKEAQAVKGAMAQVRDEVRKTIGQDYFFTVVFVTEDQAREFLRKCGWLVSMNCHIWTV